MFRHFQLARARRRTAALLVLLAIAGISPSWADASPENSADEPAQSPPTPPTPPRTPFAAETIKAAYLLKFIQFTTWPDETTEGKSPFIIGVAGNRDLEDELIDLAAGRFIRRRPIHIERIRTPASLSGCHVVFFAADTNQRTDSGLSIESGLGEVAGRPILTVSDAPNFLSLGGMVHLYRSGDKLRFRVAPDAVRSVRLILHPSLLALPGVVPPARSPSQ